MGAISQFLDHQFRHFNARETVAAAKAWKRHLAEGGEMFLSMAGAMSTAELGISLAEIIRQDKISAICCTAANLEEEIFNLFAHKSYDWALNYRDLSPKDEAAFRDRGMNRVTDTCIPEEVMRHTEHRLVDLWAAAAKNKTPKFPYEFIYELVDLPGMSDLYEIDPKDSWVLAAKEKGLPIYTPGFEDSTLGGIFTANVMMGNIEGHFAVRHGTEQLKHLSEWYIERVERNCPVGYFQIGGGIAGDFAISVVPMLIQDFHKKVPYWSYFCQISDSTTSYGSYSGAVPNEKITWEKIDVGTPSFMINSDASIVAPLIFAYVLDQ